MDWDEVRPQPTKVITVGEDLRSLSVGELEARIGALEEEIRRIRVELEAKRAHERAAAALFQR
jgi:uncharacterized small protein (DUF1192 family)